MFLIIISLEQNILYYLSSTPDETRSTMVVQRDKTNDMAVIELRQKAKFQQSALNQSASKNKNKKQKIEEAEESD